VRPSTRVHRGMPTLRRPPFIPNTDCETVLRTIGVDAINEGERVLKSVEKASTRDERSLTMNDEGMGSYNVSDLSRTVSKRETL
jgi:hypothetical protein